MNRKRSKITETKSGVALILVLGFLLILTILGIGFAVSMRTERLVSGINIDISQARQLAYVGLNDSIARIDRFMDDQDQVYPDFTDAKPLNHPRILLSDGSQKVESDDPTPTWLKNFSESTEVAYLPDFDYTTERLNKLAWTNITTDPGNGNNDTIIGRYAYIAVDCSGLIDINSAGATNERTRSLSPEEMRISKDRLKEINSSDPEDVAEAIRADRSQFIRFETLPELRELSSVLSRPDPDLQNLFVYSHYPNAQPESQALKAYIGGNPANWGTTAVSNAIVKSDLDLGSFSVKDFYMNMHDYADEDHITSQLDKFSTERVPMISEVVFSNTVHRKSLGMAYDYSNTVSIAVELAHPFPNSNSENQSFDFEIEFGDNETDPSELEPNFNNFSGSWQNPDPLTYKVFRETFSSDIYTLTNALEDYETSLAITNMEVILNGRTIDQSMGNLEFTNSINTIDKDKISFSQTAYAVDPRINYDLDDNELWKLGSEGEITLENFNNERVRFMRVKNAAISNVAALGYLSTGTPTNTIKLYGDDPDKVLDYFRVDSNAVRRGIVNLNTINEDVLETAFAGTSNNFMKAKEAQEAVFDKNSERDWDRLSDFGKIIADTDIHSLFDEIQAENFLGDHYNMVGVRQNLFTIILVVQAVDDADNSGTIDPYEVKAEQHAVAVVWRDPQKVAIDGEQINPSFIRFFRWLQE